jgi:subtilase family serine protease
MNLRLATLFLVSTFASVAAAADQIFVPITSMDWSDALGLRAHTNHLLYTGAWYSDQEGPFFWDWYANGRSASPAGYHPEDIRGAYGDSAQGTGAIAIVDAYNYATALADFNVFAKQFGLPQETSTSATSSSNKVLQVVYASGSKPSNDSGWAEEEALDIEWAHAMAPNAKIYLVEAANNSFSALAQAVRTAVSLSGVKQVSMSWGGSEFGGEASFDSAFNSKTVTYFASAGDQGGVPEYPAESPDVVAVGGTSLKVTNQQYVAEAAWSGSGGGPSAYEPMPLFQRSVKTVTSKHRIGPDIAAVADPSTGVAVYDSTPYYGYVGWMVFGGTSVASPVCAGLANAGAANRGAGELTWIYTSPAKFNDITSGSAGGYSATVGWDYVTGWGSPKTTGSL